MGRVVLQPRSCFIWPFTRLWLWNLRSGIRLHFYNAAVSMVTVWQGAMSLCVRQAGGGRQSIRLTIGPPVQLSQTCLFRYCTTYTGMPWGCLGGGWGKMGIQELDRLTDFSPMTPVIEWNLAKGSCTNYYGLAGLAQRHLKFFFCHEEAHRDVMKRLRKVE